MAEYIVKDGTRVTLDSAFLNSFLNESNCAEMKAQLCKEIHRQEVQDFVKKDFNLPHKKFEIDRTKIFLEMNLETVPSEMTARIFLKLIENYCNHFDKFIVFHHHNDGTKTLEFR